MISSTHSSITHQQCFFQDKRFSNLFEVQELKTSSLHIDIT